MEQAVRSILCIPASWYGDHRVSVTRMHFHEDGTGEAHCIGDIGAFFFSMNLDWSLKLLPGDKKHPSTALGEIVATFELHLTMHPEFSKSWSKAMPTWYLRNDFYLLPSAFGTRICSVWLEKGNFVQGEYDGQRYGYRLVFDSPPLPGSRDANPEVTAEREYVARFAKFCDETAVFVGKELPESANTVRAMHAKADGNLTQRCVVS